MPKYQWNTEKNIKIKVKREISFETSSKLLAEGKALDAIDHPNQERYPSQRIFILEIEGYIYLVPFVENNRDIFLKTIIPSRKMKKKYLGD